MGTRRVVGGIRLSSLTEETTSPARQRALIETWASANNATIVGWAEDLDVSAKIPPWERPELGPWLTEKIDQFDVLVFAKLDRAVRSLNDFVDLDRMLAHGGTSRLVILDPPIDLTDMWGRALAQILAVFAELERQMISKRTKEGFDAVISAGRWPGGRVPWGYRKIRIEGKDGWWLIPDEETAEIIRKVVDNIISGSSARAEAQRLMREGVPAPGGQPAWHPGNLARLLRSRSLLGQWQMKDDVARDSKGLPIQRADPVIDSATWVRLQETLDANRKPGNGNRSDGSPLLRVVFCAVCGRPMYITLRPKTLKSGKKVYRYYRCASYNQDVPEPCKGSNFNADTLERIISDEFLSRVGDLEVERKVFQPGEDHAEALETAQAAYNELTEQLSTTRSSSGRKALRERLRALDEMIEDLEAKPSRPASWAYEGTGQTHAELWKELSAQERGAFLRDAGVEVFVGRAADGGPAVLLVLPEDLERRAAGWSSSRS
jgi:site-specific DNA recombinase